MANFPTMAGKPVYDPARLAANGGNLPKDFIGLANSFDCPSGMEPGGAWLLMLRSDLDALSKAGSLDSLQKLIWVSDYDKLTVPSLLFHKAVCMSPSQNETDTNALYLTRWVDKRHLMKMATMIPTGVNDGTNTSGSTAYNYRCPDPPATSGATIYYADTLISGVTIWTWQTMLNNLWALLPSNIRGTPPVLPYTPDGTPENFEFLATTPWLAIESILNKIRVVLLYDPQADVFSYARLGTTQGGLTSSFSTLVSRLNMDYWPIEKTAARIPQFVRVFFQQVEQQDGSEPETQQATGNSRFNQAYYVQVASGVSGAWAGTVATVWDDLVCQLDISGSRTNDTALNSRAAEVAANYVSTIQTSDTRARKLYSGLSTTILPGSQINRVLWRDFGDGIFTEYFSNPSGLDEWSDDAETLQPPDVGRKTLPAFPEKIQTVRIDGGSSPSGYILTFPDATTGLYLGHVLSMVPGQLGGTLREVCAIQLLDIPPFTIPTTPPIPVVTGCQFLARLVGTVTVAMNVYPCYVVQGITRMRWQVKAQSASASGKVSVKWFSGGFAVGTAFDVTTPMQTGATGLYSLNIPSGEIFWIRADLGDHIGGVQFFVDDWNYIDQPVGTIRPIVTGTTVPRGWAMMNSTANSVANGGSAVDLTGSVIGGSTLGAVSLVAVAGTIPVAAVTFIERLNTPS